MTTRGQREKKSEGGCQREREAASRRKREGDLEKGEKRVRARRCLTRRRAHTHVTNDILQWNCVQGKEKKTKKQTDENTVHKREKNQTLSDTCTRTRANVCASSRAKQRWGSELTGNSRTKLEPSENKIRSKIKRTEGT